MDAGRPAPKSTNGWPNKRPLKNGALTQDCQLLTKLWSDTSVGPQSGYGVKPLRSFGKIKIKNENSSFHSFIFHSLSGVRSRKKQLQQGGSDFPLPIHFLQLFQGKDQSFSVLSSDRMIGAAQNNVIDYAQATVRERSNRGRY